MRMLNKNSSERITIKDALDHPFFRSKGLIHNRTSAKQQNTTNNEEAIFLRSNPEQQTTKLSINNSQSAAMDQKHLQRQSSKQKRNK